MTGNPLSGHTKANAGSMTGSATFTDGLTDGEHIVSPTLSNLLEGVHGNGIILEEDTANTDSDRNTPEDLPGVCEQVTNSYTVRVAGGHVVIDGVLYEFANGPGSSADIALTSSSANARASYSALTSGQEVAIVIYASTDTSNDCITWEMGTPITTATNAYPTTPSAFLTEPKSSLGVKQSVVLAVMRAVYSATGGDLKLNLSESNDKRVFVRPAPMYLTPVVSGAVGGTTGVTNIDTLHSGQTGSLSGSRLGAIWQSYNADGGANLYYSAKDNGGTRHTHLLGPTYVNVSSPSSNQTFTMGSNRIFVLTPSTTINLNPSGTFPQGYMVFVDVPSGSTVTFDSSGVNTAIASGTGAVFAYSGSAWKKVLSSGGGGGIASVVADTTPQLGGDLDVNGNKIVSASSGNIEIEPNGTGDIILDGDVTIDASHTFRATTLPVVDINSDPNPLVLNTHAGRYLLCSSNVTLPATSTQGDQYYILNDSGSSISILRNGNNINGAASDVTLTSYKGATCIAIGSNNWIVLGV